MTVTHRRTLFAALFLSTGIALLVYIISGISLLAAVALVIAGALVLGSFMWHRATRRDQTMLRSAMRAGCIAGLLATAAYDSARFLLINVTGIAFWPFDIFTIFGQALVGAGHHGMWVTALGVLYHFANGVGFAIAYTIWIGRRGILAGIAWALLLEVLMVTFYPGWLGLKALNEFLQVSIFGHLVYGGVLGASARYLLHRNDKADDQH